MINLSPFCRCVIYLILLLLIWHTTQHPKVAICREQVTGISTCICVHNSCHRMLLFPVMVVSLVHLGPAESSWSLIIGTGTSYLSDTNSNPRQFRHCTVCWPKLDSLPGPVLRSTNCVLSVRNMCWQVDRYRFTCIRIESVWLVRRNRDNSYEIWSTIPPSKLEICGRL